MRDPGGHLAHGREPLLRRGLTLQPPGLGDVLEHEQEPGLTTRYDEPPGAQPDLNLAAARRGEPQVRPAGVLRHRFERRFEHRWQLEQLENSPAQNVGHPTPGDVLRRAVEGQHTPVPVRGRQTTGQALDDVLVERLEVGDLARRSSQTGVGAPESLGEIAAEDRHGQKPEDIETGHVERQRRRRTGHLADRGPPGLEELECPLILPHHHARVEQRAQRPDQQAAAPELQNAGSDNRQRVQGREVAGHPAGQQHDGRDHDGVGRQLQVDEPASLLDEGQGQQKHDGEGVAEPDQSEERPNGPEPRRAELYQHPRAEEDRDCHDPHADQPKQLPAQRRSGVRRPTHQVGPCL